MILLLIEGVGVLIGAVFLIALALTVIFGLIAIIGGLLH